MEFGSIMNGEMIYVGDVPDRSSEQRAAFMERARAWKIKHDIGLGEGYVRILELGGEIAYLLRAPLAEDCPDINEVIRKTPYLLDDQSDTI